MSDVPTIRAALAAALATVGSDVQVSAYLLPVPNPPTLQVLPRENDYDQAFHRGMDRRTFVIQGFVALTEDTAAQQLLDALLAPTGSRSVKTAIESDASLHPQTGTVARCRVTSDTGYTMNLHPSGSWFLMVEWFVETLSS